MTFMYSFMYSYIMTATRKNARLRPIQVYLPLKLFLKLKSIARRKQTSMSRIVKGVLEITL